MRTKGPSDVCKLKYTVLTTVMMIRRSCVFNRSFDAYEIIGSRDAVNQNFFDRKTHVEVLISLPKEIEIVAEHVRNLN